MSILQNLKDAQLNARKARDVNKASSLTTLIGEITTKAKSEGNREVTDQDCIKTLTKFISGQQTIVEAATTLGDVRRIGEANAEIFLYQTFLPVAKPQLTDEALQDAIRNAIATRITADKAKPKMGVVIADIKAQHEGAYDPKALTPLVKAELEATADPSVA